MRWRKFKVILSHDLQDKKKYCGVYCLNIGRHFYVGRSLDIRKRATQHRRDLEVLFDDHIEQPLLFPREHYRVKMFNYLYVNPQIETLYVTLLELCSPEEIVECEQKWIDKKKDEVGFMNLGLVARPYPQKSEL